jgi:NADH-quinone oxidoreductase subunit C
MAKALVELLKQQFPSAIVESHAQCGDDTVVLESSKWKEVAAFLKSDARAAMDMLIDLTCVDFPDRDPRFEVVVHLYSLGKGHRLRLKARVGDEWGEAAEIDSLSDIWASANWAEREAWDMFGVRFRGHPDLRRILMYPEFNGHPLRKDYPANEIQPLVPYREIPNIDRLPPFGADEGMSFGRQSYEAVRENDEVVFATDAQRTEPKGSA